MKRLVTCFLLAVLVVGIAQAEELRIGRYFSDGMILQRDKPNVIRGTAAAGAEVKVSFGGQEKAGRCRSCLASGDIPD